LCLASVLIAAWSRAGVIKASSKLCLDAGGQKDFCQGCKPLWEIECIRK
jgi:hypothetical protein